VKFAIRTDASSLIGSGHVMRCLSLADALSHLGNDVIFICKAHKSNLINRIIDSGYQVISLALSAKNDIASPLTLEKLLGGTQQDDAQKTIAAVKSIKVEWMIVDHYALDKYWHKKIRQYVKRIFVIDDLGNRKYDCDILLDQNLGSTNEKYQGIVPNDCKLLLGPKYALLRPDFSKWRDKSLKKRKHVKIPKNILVSLGGVDLQNVTIDIIKELSRIPFLANKIVNVVLGSQSPHINSVKSVAESSCLEVCIHTDTKHMAELMSLADLAIGASGSSSWERCALGLPSINFVIADNQLDIALALEKAGAIITVHSINDLSFALNTAIKNLKSMSFKSSLICDGFGSYHVSNFLNMSQ